MLRERERERVCFLSVWIVFVGVWVWGRRERCKGYFWYFEKRDRATWIVSFKKVKNCIEVKNKNNYIYSNFTASLLVYYQTMSFLIFVKNRWRFEISALSVELFWTILQDSKSFTSILLSSPNSQCFVQFHLIYSIKYVFFFFGQQIIFNFVSES